MSYPNYNLELVDLKGELAKFTFLLNEAKMQGLKPCLDSHGLHRFVNIFEEGHTALLADDLHGNTWTLYIDSQGDLHTIK